MLGLCGERSHLNSVVSVSIEPIVLSYHHIAAIPRRRYASSDINESLITYRRTSLKEDLVERLELIRNWYPTPEPVRRRHTAAEKTYEVDENRCDDNEVIRTIFAGQ